MSQDVFISYSSLDRQTADQLYRALSEAGFKVWMDTKRLEHGDVLHADILQNIRSDTAFVLLNSYNSINSEWVSLELSTAVSSRADEEGGIFVVRLDKSPVPKILSDVKFTDLSDSEKVTGEVRKLVSGVRKWSRKSYLLSSHSSLSSFKLMLLPSLMSPFMATFFHMLMTTTGFLPTLALYTDKIELATYALTLMYGFFAGPVLGLTARFVSKAGALNSTGINEELLSRLYQQQQVKLLYFFAWMGTSIPFTLEVSLIAINSGTSVGLLFSGFIMPFISAGVGTILIGRMPGPNPLLP